MRYLKQLKEIKESVTTPTYMAGLAQARAYRLLQSNFNRVLQPFDLTMSEWAMLGCIYDAGELRLSELAEVMDIKPPQVTVMTEKLIGKGLIKTVVDTDDNRSRIVSLTDAGTKLVPQAEAEARSFMRKYMHGVSPGDLLAYLRVIAFLADK